MKRYIRKKVLCLDENTYSVVDEDGNKKYEMKFEVLLGKRICIMDELGNEVATIQQELKSLIPRYSVYFGEEKVMDITKKFHLLPKYTIDGFGWEIRNGMMLHSYELTQAGEPVMKICRTRFGGFSAYELEITNPWDELAAVAAAATIECAIEHEHCLTTG